MALNLSNQANVNKSSKSNLCQFNYFVILGLEYLDDTREGEDIPIVIDIDKTGELTINGLDEDLVKDNNIFICSDKKVTDSNS